MRATHAIRIRGWLVALVFLGSGCSSSKQEGPPTYPVRGELFYKGRPAARALVVFRPCDGSVKGPWPNSVVGRDGQYQLTLRRLHDGAPAGDYAITATLLSKGSDGDDGPNILPPRYARPETSDLRATVTPGDNVIPRIDLAP